MFKLQPNPTFWAPVSIPVPHADNEAVIEIEFNHKTKVDLDAYLKLTAQPETKDPDSIGEIVKDWKGLDVDFNTDHLNTLLNNYPSAGRAILRAYIVALTEGRKKN